MSLKAKKVKNVIFAESPKKATKKKVEKKKTVQVKKNSRATTKNDRNMEFDYSKVKLADLPKNADGTPKKKYFVLWLIEKLNRAIPKNKRKNNSL